MKYIDWLRKWLSLCAATSKEPTVEKYELIIRRHINPTIGSYELNTINAEILRNFSLGLISNGLAPNTIKGIQFVVKSSLRSAVDFGFMVQECTQAMVVPRNQEKRVSALSLKEQRVIEHYIITRQKPEEFGIIFSLYTGIRIGELLALQWKDIDLIRGTAYIHKTSRDVWKNNAYQKCIYPPKTSAANRCIPIPKQLIPLLRQLYRGNENAFLVENAHKHCLQTRSYQEMFSKILRRLNIPHKGFHSLRHTFATRALECGMDIKTLSEILGHANPSITLKRYAHSMLEHKINMMNRVGKMLLSTV